MVTYSDTGAGAATPASISYEYDLNGNVRRNYFQYTALDAQGNPGTGTIPRDYWYMYDAMNRFVLTKGQFTGTRGSGTISSAPDSSGKRPVIYAAWACGVAIQFQGSSSATRLLG